MEIIDELEPVRRGFYGGTVATSATAATWTRRSRSATMVFHGDTYSFQAGAGIVADSVPVSEYREVLAQERSAPARARARAGGAVMGTAPRLLLVDNYDSFTYNLVQAFLVLGADVLVHRNDEITVDQARALAPTHLCISPGPARRATPAYRWR